MSTTVDLLFDVPGIGGGDAVIAGSVVAPDPGVPVRAQVLLMVPGGGYTRSYWHPAPSSLPDGYSAADHLAGRGHIVVIVDNLATGASSRPAGVPITPELMGDALHLVGEQVRARASAGTLTASVGPLTTVELVGVGHSMGGLITVVQQAAHRTYDRVAVLGYSALTPPGLEGVELTGRVEAAIEQIRSMAEAVDGDPELVRTHRAGLRPIFYGDFVTADVIAADEAAGTVMPVRGGASALCFGYIAAAAAAIDRPVLLAFGELDVSFAPRREPAAYEASSDITLYVLPGSAHCHNLAPTRALLWDRLAAWL